MCLIYDHAATESAKAEDKPLVLYKLYMRYSAGCLTSPYKKSRINGQIGAAGTVHAELEQRFEETDLLTGYLTGSPPYHQSFLPKFDGKSVSISGFHCFTTMDAATKYLNGVSKTSSVDTIAKVRIIKVCSHTKHLIAVGKTPFYASDENPPDSADSVVVSEMTIAEDDFQKAVV